MSKKNWKSREKITAVIVKAFSNENDTVEHLKKVFDQTTQRYRIHDIVKSIYIDEKTFLISYEVRSQFSPVDSPQVEAHIIKCKDAAVDEGVMISFSGFSKPAINKAKAYGIRLIEAKKTSKLKFIAKPKNK